MNNAFTFNANAMRNSILSLLLFLFLTSGQAQMISFSPQGGIQFEANKEMKKNRFNLDMSEYVDSMDLKAYAKAMHSNETAVLFDPETFTFTVRIETRMRSNWNSNEWNSHFAILHENAQNN